MFPLSSFAILAFTASAPFLAGALTGVLRRRWLILTLSAAALVFYLVYIRHALSLDAAYARQMAASVFGAIFLAAWLLGEVWGFALRLLRHRTGLTLPAALAIAILPALAATGWTLTRQYVPSACLDGLTINIADQPFRLQTNHNARLAWLPGGSGETWARYSNTQSTKDDLAQLCRDSANGTRPLTPDEITVGDHGTRTTSCQGNACLTSDTSEFRLVSTSPTNPVRPSPWFEDNTRDDIRWSGTSTDGWICFLPNGSLTWLACQRWITPHPGLRAQASADFDPTSDPKTAIPILDNAIRDWLTLLSPN